VHLPRFFLRFPLSSVLISHRSGDSLYRVWCADYLNRVFHPCIERVLK
jgi:hypothetical protein